MTVALAAVHHDPAGQTDAQAARILPRLQECYAGLVVSLSPQTADSTSSLIASHGKIVRAAAEDGQGAWAILGRRRREAVDLALEAFPDACHVHFCDFDRILHWAEFQLAELQTVVERICLHDFTVLGRSERAFATHPRVQRDTEAIINHAFELASGLPWDVSAAARGLSRDAAKALAESCADDSIGNDCSWPLCVQRARDLTLAYVACEGLEFETPDRYPNEIAAAGGLANWLAQIDRDPAHWARRLELARVEVESIVRFGTPLEPAL